MLVYTYGPNGTIVPVLVQPQPPLQPLGQMAQLPQQLMPHQVLPPLVQTVSPMMAPISSAVSPAGSLAVGMSPIQQVPAFQHLPAGASPAVAVMARVAQSPQVSFPLTSPAPAVPAAVLADPTVRTLPGTRETTPVDTEELDEDRDIEALEGSGEGDRVFLLMGIKVTADLQRLVSTLPGFLHGRRVVRCLPLWNKGAALVELDKPFKLPSRRFSLGPRIYLMPSRKLSVVRPTPGKVLNVRFYVLDEILDGDTVRYDDRERPLPQAPWGEALQDVASEAACALYLKLGALITSIGGVAWTTMHIPKLPLQHTDQRRWYTQLFFTYDDSASAIAVFDQVDGKIREHDGVQVVIRPAFAAHARSVVALRSYHLGRWSL